MAVERYAWLSVAAAVATIALKTVAWWLTGSVGLLSDALESLVNLAAALLALSMLRLAASPPDAEHPYGFSKAEYFSAGIEGALIVLAAAGIVWTAIPRLLAPRALEMPLAGLSLTVVASAITLGVALILIRKGRENHSITLEADGKHLMTDVWTSAGVIAGVALVYLTGWLRFAAVGGRGGSVHILWTGFAAGCGSTRSSRWGSRSTFSGPASASCAARCAVSSTRRSPPRARTRSPSSSRSIRTATACPSTRSVRARRARAGSSHSTCSCPMPGPSRRRTSSPRRSSPTFARWCRTRACSRTSSRSRIRRRTTTRGSTAEAFEHRAPRRRAHLGPGLRGAADAGGGLDCRARRAFGLQRVPRLELLRAPAPRACRPSAPHFILRHR